MKRRRSSGNGLISLTDLQSLVGAYKAQTATLRRKLEGVDTEMAHIEAALASILGGGTSRGAARPARGSSAKRAAGAKAGRRAGGRRKKGQDLSSMIEGVLAKSSSPMGIPAIVSAVKAAGYRSSSPSFARIVGMRLGDRKRFRRAARGMYEVAKKKG